MNKHFFYILMVSLITTSCNNKSKNEPFKTQPSLKKVITPIKSLDTSNLTNSYWVQRINLNNGDKWQANPETTKEIHAMLKILKETEAFKVEDYQKLGKHLNKSKTVIITSCTMEGLAHDNLHVYLLPLIEKIHYLSRASTMEEGQIIKENIQTHLEMYNSYFDTNGY
ncbi:hypothetical protein [Xanthomarina gelatinilytica]|uniref:hypothetical protein n=1 Tax=Xanthomarina gelatinilytica TaxID=1137281 RepID=UPI003AA7FB04